MRRLIILGLFLLLIVNPVRVFAVENVFNIPGIGPFIVSPQISIVPLQAPVANYVGNTLVSRDNTVLRSVNIFFVPLDNVKRKDIKKNTTSLDDKLNQLILLIAKNENNTNIVSMSALDNKALANEKFIIKSAKFIAPFAMRLDFYLLNTTNGVVILGAFSPDCDSMYWNLVLSNMTNEIKH